MAAVWGWILWVTGVTDPYWNNWWGGFFGDISYFGIFVVVWKRLECHAPGCHRIGLHRTADGTYMLCRRHHPDVPNKLRLEDIHAAHFSAKKAAERTMAATVGAVVADSTAGVKTSSTVPTSASSTAAESGSASPAVGELDSRGLGSGQSVGNPPAATSAGVANAPAQSGQPQPGQPG